MKTRIFLYLTALLLSMQPMLAQLTVTGKVFDDGGSELPGVSVLVKGTTIGTMTLGDGSFSISVPDSLSVLIFSYIGMETLELQLKDNSELSIIMDYAETEFEEVVVTAIGIKRTKKSLSYSTSSNLSGKVAGVNVRVPGLKIKGNNGGGNVIEPEMNTEEYDFISENTFKSARDNPVSTFSIDVDNASYTNVRRFLNSGQMPTKDAVRIEEMINYFDYDYPDPQGEHPFSFITEYSDCPWNTENKLLHIGIQGKRMDYNDFKPSNFVFLIDVSGSMADQNKLPLLKKSFIKLLDTLGRNDVVSMVVYAGAAGMVLPPTPAFQKEKIKNALNKLESGGSTAGGAGIQLAYKVAEENFIQDGNNRVILATDGDFNVGASSSSDMVRLIEEKRKTGIYLTILGFGMGNYKDGRMEQISNAGNGNYFYIDDIKEADKVFGREMRANMFTIAKDVKIQIEFNPANVKSYRLIGYENRILNKEDFEDDTKDAGELGPGHTVTAIYEIVPVDSKSNKDESQGLKYQNWNPTNDFSDELMTLKFRYKPPQEEKSILIEHSVKNKTENFEKTSEAFRFSAAVVGFGMLLRDSEFKGTFDYELVKKITKNSMKEDEFGYKKEFLELVKKAESISGNLSEN